MVAEGPEAGLPIVAAVALRRGDGRVLLVRHTDAAHPGAAEGRWTLPAEPVADDEVVETALARLLQRRLHLSSDNVEFSESVGLPGAIANVFTCADWSGDPAYSADDYADAAWAAPHAPGGVDLAEGVRNWLASTFPPPQAPQRGDTPQVPAGGDTPQAPAGGDTPQAPAGGDTPQAPARGDTPQAPARGDTPQAPAGGDTPQAPARGDTPQAPARGDTPQVPAGGDTPQAPAGGDTPQVPAGGDTPQAPARGDTPQAPARGDTPQAPARGDTPQAPARGDTPQAPARGDTPQAPARGDTPQAPARGDTPQAPARGDTPQAPARGDTPQAPARGDTPQAPAARVVPAVATPSTGEPKNLIRRQAAPAAPSPRWSMTPDDLVAELEAARGALSAAYERFDEAWLDVSLDGDWAPVDLLAHCATVEAYYASEARRLAEEPGHTWRGFNPDQSAAERTGQPRPEDRPAQARLLAIRADTLTWVEGLEPDDLAAYGNHAERGAVRVGERIQKIATHDREHTEQLAAMLAATEDDPDEEGA